MDESNNVMPDRIGSLGHGWYCNQRLHADFQAK